MKRMIASLAVIMACGVGAIGGLLYWRQAQGSNLSSTLAYLLIGGVTVVCGVLINLTVRRYRVYRANTRSRVPSITE